MQERAVKLRTMNADEEAEGVAEGFGQVFRWRDKAGESGYREI